jgi:hypothetical protein
MNRDMETHIRQINIDEKGQLKDLMPATPIAMCCEHHNCTEQKGNDYKRLPSEEEIGWEDEPIFLCDEHGENRELF